ncbi:MAG: BamA/TamA family outer membrane protein [Bacteroidales bacterium]|nr:BamA/TamA family outer membrane protein [Bacteroidales bacterium]
MQTRKITQIIQIFIISILLFFSNNTYSQTKNKKRLTKVKIEIDKNKYDKKNAGFEKYDIEQLIKPKPNSRFLFMPLKYWIYNLPNQEKVTKKEKKREERCSEKNKKKIGLTNTKIRRLEKNIETPDKKTNKYKRQIKKLRKLQIKKDKQEEKNCEKQYWSKKLGEEPVYISENDYFRNRRKVRVFLKNKGYYQIKIDTINTYKSKNRIKITYKILQGKPYLISDIKYKIEDNNIYKIVTGNSKNSLLKKGNRFDIQTIEYERKRISDNLRNEGYYNFSKDFIFFSVDTIGKNKKADITVNISKIKDKDGNEIIYKKHIIKNVFIYPYFKPNEALRNKNKYYQNHDTIIYYSKTSKKFNFIYNNIPRINPKAIARGLYVAPGDYFNLNKIKSSYKYLASLPVIQTANINFSKSKTFSEISDSVQYIDCEIKLTQDESQVWELTTETTHTSGNWGIAANLNYIHNNFFRNTETFNLKLNGELKRITKNPNYEIPEPIGIFNSRKFGADLSIKFPRLFIPFPLKKFIQRSNPKTIVNAKFSYTDRPDYSWSVAGGAMNYSWNKTKAIKHSIGPAADFLKVFNHFEEVVLPENYDDRFVLGLPYKFTFNNQSDKNRKNNFYITAYAKAAGNLLYKYMDLRNKEKVDGSYILLGNAFAQFIKTDFEIRYYKDLNRAKDKFVFRLFAGAAFPYGNLNVIPFSEQYYSGGANGIRAWEERSLGPGSYFDPNQDSVLYYRQRSDIKLEGNIEYRMKLFWKMEGAFFVDAGNIWAINEQDNREGALFDINKFYKEIAIGSGFGIRMDFDFLILRLDIGLKVKDPSLPEGNRWIPVNQLITANNMKFNIGIGYPF